MPENAKNEMKSALDPRALILFCVIFSCAVACLQNLTACVAALFFAVCSIAIGRPALRVFPRRLLAANIFILFMWLLVPWTTPGAPTFKLGWFTASETGIELCLLITLKANALILVFMALVSPIGMSSLSNALLRLHCPEKLAWLFLLMGRAIHLLTREWTILAEAARLRGFRAGANMHSYRTLAALLALLLVGANDRAERMREAMLLRGFSGRLPVGPPLHFSLRDAFLGLFLLFSLLIILFLEFNPSVFPAA